VWGQRSGNGSSVGSAITQNTSKSTSIPTLEVGPSPENIRDRKYAGEKPSLRLVNRHEGELQGRGGEE